MRLSVLAVTSVAAVSLACQSLQGPRVRQADPARREALFSAVSALAGEWHTTADEEFPGTSTFEVTSGNTVVRETMLPGTELEMTNMYALDGNDLVMTHYCAGGNQPRMRATTLDGDRLAFHFEDVGDLKSADEVYMGEMTLVFVDDHTIEQHWRAFKNGALDHEMVFSLERAD